MNNGNAFAAVDTTPARRPHQPKLKGERITIVPLDPAAHSAPLYEGTHAERKEDLWRYLAEGPFADRKSFRAAMEKKAASEDPLFLAIVDNRTGITVGTASYLRIDPVHRTIEVGWILYTPQLQRTPAATEVMYLMAKHVFDDLGYRRYEWKCDALNAPSRRAALRLGFTFEGIFRQHMIVKGRNRDTAWYSMLDSEWPSRKRAFERWLSPANFDAEGRQRASLVEFQ
jgi:RimJ/RimL family protein N-acetyltransferase